MIRPILVPLAAALAVAAGLAATGVYPKPAQAAAPSAVPDPSFELELGGMRFDPLVAFPGSAHRATTEGPDLRLVQFSGPIRPEWLSRLADDGVRVMQYIHPYSYVVWADPASLGRSAARPEVRWSGDFIPEFRLTPEHRGLDRSVRPTMALVSRHADETALRASLQAAGAQLEFIAPVNRHFSVAQFTAPGNRYADIAAIRGVYAVQDIEPRSEEEMYRGEMSNQSVVGAHGPAPGYTIVPGYEDWLAGTGYDGTGVIVSIVDGGVRLTHQDLVGQGLPCVSAGDSPTSCSALHSDHGTHVGAAVAGTGASGVLLNGFLRGQGVAPGARLVSQRYGSFLGSGPGAMIPNGMLTIFREAALSGAVLANNSWGPTGSPQGYDIPTQQIDIIARDALADVPGQQPVLPVWSIMNGHGDGGGACAPASLGSPDEAKNLFAVGSTALQSGGTQLPGIFNISSNSAHGNACDGRRVPHIVAPGCSTDSASNASDSAYTLMCGTSMASPVVSGSVAVFIEKYRDMHGGATPSPALVKAAFTAAARDLAGFTNADGGVLGHRPDRFQGYGRLDLEAVANPPQAVFYFDQEHVFTASGQNWTWALMAADPAQPIRIMLAWTDAPGHGLGGTTPAWVNNLDLVVTTGTGTYLGNVVGGDGWSATGGSPDDRNNLEGVFLAPSQHGGAVTVTVQAANIAADALDPHDPGAPAQDFALVCYNCVAGDGFGLVVTPAAAEICAPDDAHAGVDVFTSGAFSEPVALAATSLPGSATATFDPAIVDPAPGSSALTIGNTGTVAPGTYAIGIEGSHAGETRTAAFQLTVATTSPAAPALAEPADGSTAVASTPTFSWDPVPGATSYRLEVARDAAFAQLVIDETVTGTTYTPDGVLDPDTTYHWRASAGNACGGSTPSPVFTFTTANAICWSGHVSIPDGNPGGVDIDLVVGQSATVDRLRVSLRYDHSWVGDSRITLQKLGGPGPVALVDRPGVPASTYGCAGANVDAIMDDDAAVPAETGCDANAVPALEGTFSPNQPLSAFTGSDLAGTWRLNAADLVGDYAGTMLEWCLLPDTGDGTPGVTADLGITMSAGPDPVAPGGALTFAIQAENFGPDTATGVSVDIELPPELAYAGFRSVLPEDAVLPLGSAWSCSPAGSAVTCALAGNLIAPGPAPVLEIFTGVDPQAVPGAISTTAGIHGDQTDPVADNDSVTVLTQISDASDLIFASGFE